MFAKALIAELEKTAGFGGMVPRASNFHTQRLMALKKPQAAPQPKPKMPPKPAWKDAERRTINVPGSSKPAKPSPKFDMRQDAMRKALAKRYEEKAPGRPWYKHPAAMIGGGALAGYMGSRLLNRDE